MTVLKDNILQIIKNTSTVAKIHQCIRTQYELFSWAGTCDECLV